MKTFAEVKAGDTIWLGRHPGDIRTVAHIGNALGGGKRFFLRRYDPVVTKGYEDQIHLYKGSLSHDHVKMPPNKNYFTTLAAAIQYDIDIRKEQMPDIKKLVEAAKQKAALLQREIDILETYKAKAEGQQKENDQ